MATTSNVRIKYGTEDELNKLHCPVASATVLAPGDLLLYSTGAVSCVTADTDQVTFIGASLDISRNGDTAMVNVLLKGILNVGVTSAAYVVGEALGYVSGANGTDWTLASVSSGAKGIAHSLQVKTDDELDVIIDTFLISTSIGSGSGLWEAFAS